MRRFSLSGQKGFTAVETIILLAVICLAIYFVIFSYFNFQIVPISKYVELAYIREAEDMCRTIWTANKIYQREHKITTRIKRGRRWYKTSRNVYIGWQDTNYVEVNQADLEKDWPKGLNIDFSATQYFTYSTCADSVIATGIAGGMEVGDDGINPVKIIYSPNDPEAQWKRINFWKDLKKFKVSKSKAVKPQAPPAPAKPESPVTPAATAPNP